MTRIRAALVLLLAGFAIVPAGAEIWNFSAERVTSVQRDSGTRTVLDGDARVASDNLIITADHLEFVGPDSDWIFGSGGIRLIDTEDDITVESREFDYDRVEKLIHFRESVTLVDDEEGIVIRCESLDLFEDDDFAIMQASVRLIKDDIVGRGEFALFQRDENILELSGRPVVWQDGDEFRADRIIVDLDTDEITLEGTVEGSLITDEEE